MGAAVLVMGMYLASPNLAMFVDYPSMFIVFGGSFTACAISFQMNRMLSLVKIFLLKMLKGQKYDMQKTVIELMQLSDAYRKGESLSGLKDKTKDFFLKDALQLLDDGIFTPEEAIELIEERNGSILYNYMDDANKIKTVGKYPPAFGMIGTTIGMVVLLANLGGEDAMKMIGPAMGVCLITTLYGAAASNMFLLPIADNLTEGAKEVNLKNKIIVQGVKLLITKSNPIVMAEKLNTYLRPGDRVDWKEIVGKA